jgi:hypothetical protein
MNNPFSRSSDDTTILEEQDKENTSWRSKRRERPRIEPEEKKDPTRFVSVLLFFIFLFISYLFWAR